MEKGRHCEGSEAISAFIGSLESNFDFDYAKRLEDCHCEGKARNNLQPTKTQIALSFHFSQ